MRATPSLPPAIAKGHSPRIISAQTSKSCRGQGLSLGRPPAASVEHTRETQSEGGSPRRSPGLREVPGWKCPGCVHQGYDPLRLHRAAPRQGLSPACRVSAPRSQTQRPSSFWPEQGSREDQQDIVTKCTCISAWSCSGSAGQSPDTLATLWAPANIPHTTH